MSELSKSLAALRAALPQQPAPDTTPEFAPAELDAMTRRDLPAVPLDSTLDALEQAATALNPQRAYAGGHSGPDWERERNHPAHRAANALGLVLGHVLSLAPHVLGHRVDHAARRIVAHVLHGVAHGVHPGQ